MTPKVYNQHHRNAPSDAIFVGRPSIFGNPFVVSRTRTRTEAVELYEKYLLDKPSLLDMVKVELQGKNLICFCAPLSCHADVLLKYANEALEWAEWSKSLDSQLLSKQPPKEDNV